ncbi:MgtC/SapB family protein [Schaalia hyovaginalis]|uniref:Mg2+ transporter-C (MgtC) family protein n=1 Tax=Schaalia hyovaginalis TaxID=29316 RepID=A0A923E274_9ACTO|nr:MgtC/SapB family protein [Schaalia hyovaginalis]MBB6333543.1 putative Mg2+ transporter-C (MgtC) family protein [Schaalia hyovaginalis]MDY2669079.1 MgtC/SapB family protein [Schaalia hyovaginalis]
MGDLFSFAHFGYGVGALAMTGLLCSILGLERHYHLKDAGVKTHVLVGVGACLFTLVSVYGFGSSGPAGAPVDPSRLAAQVVSGIGFLGAGLIFVNNDTVKGLTTAATVWVSASIGVACGVGMVLLACVTVLLHVLLVFAVGPLLERIPSRKENDRLVVEYEAEKGVLRRILVTASGLGFAAMVNSTERIDTEHGRGVRAIMRFEGSHSLENLMKRVADIEGVNAVDRIEHSTLD